ncbi:MAG: lipase family protein [Nitrosarchaeum sp.]|nr:lipase family protein [Nitrosarchaeum sp.]
MNFPAKRKVSDAYDLLEKLNRYCRISMNAGTIKTGGNPKFAGVDYNCITQFSDAATSCEGNIFVRTDCNDKIVVAFKGSVEAKDWFRDFWAWQLNWPYAKTYDDMKNVKIHAGFKNQYSSVRAKILRELSDLIKKFQASGVTPHITFCGHSLGGALSIIAVLDTFEIFSDQAILSAYTYGNPKVYNVAGHDAFDHRVEYAYRTVYSNDVVPQVPWWPSFKHVGNPIHITKSMNIACEEYNRKLIDCTPIDHFVENYANAYRLLLNTQDSWKPLEKYIQDPPSLI